MRVEINEDAGRYFESISPNPLEGVSVILGPIVPGGGKVGPDSISFPMPARVSEKPQILNLQELISLKLSSYLGSPIMLLNGKSTTDKVRNIE